MPKAIRTLSRKTERTKSLKSKVKSTESEADIGYCEEGETIQPPDNLLDHAFLIYGESGIGKTSICSKIPGSYIIQCDPNRKGLGIRQTNIDNTTLIQLKKVRPKLTPWDKVVLTMDRICDDDSVKCVVIDNFDLFYQSIFRHRCYQIGINDPSEENDFGQTWRDIEDNMTQQLNRLLYSNKGVVLITHEQTKEVEAGSSTYERIEPACMKAPFRWIKACTDFGFYLSYGDSGERIWNIRGDREIWLKSCTDEDSPHFYSPDGEPVRQISAGNSPREAWANLIKSWNNELDDISKTKTGRQSKKFKREKIS